MSWPDNCDIAAMTAVCRPQALLLISGETFVSRTIIEDPTVRFARKAAENANNAALNKANRALTIGAQCWFLTAALGQWIFVAYIIAVYAIVRPEDKLHLIAGDSLGNLALILHLSIAVIIIGGGPLQLIPQIRQRFPGFHRWLGRIYIPAAILTSLGGIYLIWTREVPGGLIMNLGITLDGILIIVFSAMALKFALARQLKVHRRWALRMFLAVSAVWFFRIGFSLWIMVHGAPVGFDPETFTGPFMNFIIFAQYLLPLAILECYFKAQDSQSSIGKVMVAILLLIAALMTAAGTFAATLIMWLPDL